MAGLNQTIMLALSMVVISAMIGADGLGKTVYEGITQMNMAKGFEGGLAVVVLAMLLDRITQSLGVTKKKSGKILVNRFPLPDEIQSAPNILCCSPGNKRMSL
jgi:glycine betaine/proline transport system permease protein